MDRSRSSDHPTHQHGAAHDDFFARERDWTPQLEGRSHMRDLQRSRGGSGVNGASWLNTAVGQRALQMRSAADRHAAHTDTARTHDHAARGVAGAGQPLPFLDRIQASFGAYDVSSVRAQVGGAAREASDAIGAQAYATDGRVAFRDTPDLHTAAHEAAHVVQQRHGVHLKGGVGAEGDAYERHADAVADAVVAGRDAAPVLAQMAPAPAQHASLCAAVQRKPAVQMSGDGPSPPAKAHEKGMPTFSFKGQKFAGVKGEKKITLGALPPKEVTLIDRGWDIAIPGIPPTLRAVVNVEAKANATGELNTYIGWNWDHEKGIFKFGGKLALEAKATLSGGVMAGLKLDAVLAEMGFGLFGALVGTLAISANKEIAFEVQPAEDKKTQELKLNPKLTATPLDLIITGDLASALTARVWAESFWGGERKGEWELIKQTIAEIKALRAKADLTVDGDGITPSFGAVDAETLKLAWYLPTFSKKAATTTPVPPAQTSLVWGMKDQRQHLLNQGEPDTPALWIDALKLAMDPKNSEQRAKDRHERLYGRPAPCNVGSLTDREWKELYSAEIVSGAIRPFIWASEDAQATWDAMAERLRATGKGGMVRAWLGESPSEEDAALGPPAAQAPPAPSPTPDPQNCASCHKSDDAVRQTPLFVPSSNALSPNPGASGG